MELHEYQAKNLLKECGIQISPFFVASTIKEVEEHVLQNKLKQAVVKGQVHAGGRGKAGAVKFANTPEEIVKYAKSILGMKMINLQTGPEGRVVSKVLLSSVVQVKKEYYLAITIDRSKGVVSLIVSQEGGMNIEEIHAKSPEKIDMIPLHAYPPLYDFQVRRALSSMGLSIGNSSAKKIIEGMVKAFFLYDATLIEINPLVETDDGEFIPLDAKITIDDNALFRHPDLLKMYDSSQITPQEREAREFDLAYVGLDGNIGCMVNGAGLAMATLDLIRLKGGNPANFLDVGGSATEEKVLQGFNLILSDPRVKVIFVNIFGGIMNCQTIARALVKALQTVKSKLPIVVRLEGTESEEAKSYLSQSGLPIITASSLEDGALKVVEKSRQ